MFSLRNLYNKFSIYLIHFLTVSVSILKRNVALDSVQNRAARALGNLAMDSQNSALIHSAGMCSNVTIFLSASYKFILFRDLAGIVFFNLWNYVN